MADITSSTLIQIKASAGSGKTYTLTHRFLDLLIKADFSGMPQACGIATGDRYSWPEILAVTFTNKAATEMKERLVSELKKRALDLPEAEADKAWTPQKARRALTIILRRYQQLNIRTIDSMLNLIVKLFALSLGLSPEFDIVFDEKELCEPVFERFADSCENEEQARELLEQAVETILGHEDKPGFWLLDRVKERLFGLLSSLPDIDLTTDQEEIADTLRVSYGHFRQSGEALLEHVSVTGLDATANFHKFMAKCLEADLFDGPPKSVYTDKDSFADCVKKNSKDKVGPETESLYAAFKDYCAIYRRDWAVLNGAYSLAPSVAIAAALKKELELHQQEHGLVAGSTLARRAQEALEDGMTVPDAYCRLGSRLFHLLIDEFQDTSRDQWGALSPLAVECISKGGSLFYVGDVKQAIYGWRGGDSRLFDEILAQSDISTLVETPEQDTLPNNWRSFKNIVEFNNRFFGGLEQAGPSDDLAEGVLSAAPEEVQAEFAGTIRETFRDSAQELPPKSLGTEGYVRIAKVPGGKAEAIAEQTKQGMKSLMDDLAEQRSWREIAVLVRTNSQAAAVCDWLVSWQIPVITENSLQLAKHPAVSQIAALLAFLDFPENDVAFMEFITGREVFGAESGLDERTVYTWLTKPGEGPLHRRFREWQPKVWEQLLEPFFNKSGLMSPYDLAGEAARAFRVIERYPHYELFVRRFLEVVHLAEENGCRSLSAFLDFWEKQGLEEKIPLPENVDAVKILTIHKSKGLEYPVVIVPFHDWNIPRTNSETVALELYGKPFVTPLTRDLGGPYYEAFTRVAAEHLNLLYVAWTRAREELYGFLPAERSNRQPSLVLSAIERILGDGFSDEGIFEHGPRPGFPEIPPHRHAVCPEAEHALPALDTPVELMGWLPRLRVHQNTVEDYSYDKRMRGEIAHKALEYLKITGQAEHDAKRAADLAMDDFPVPSSIAAALREEIQIMIKWLLSQEELVEYIEHGDPETEFAARDGSLHRADLLYRGENRTVVVEYKTGQPEPEHAKQVRRYLKLLSAMPGTPEDRFGVIVYLDQREITRVALPGGRA